MSTAEDGYGDEVEQEAGHVVEAGVVALVSGGCRLGLVRRVSVRMSARFWSRVRSGSPSPLACSVRRRRIRWASASLIVAASTDIP